MDPAHLYELRDMAFRHIATGEELIARQLRELAWRRQSRMEIERAYAFLQVLEAAQSEFVTHLGQIEQQLAQMQQDRELLAPRKTRRRRR